MKKVIIIGCPGSGKSTFARKLKDKTGLPLYYIDMIWHKPDKTMITREDLANKLNEIYQTDEWILDGNYKRTMPDRLNACDTVFLFDLPTDICLQGAISRVGKKRVDMPWIEETLDQEFKEYIENFAAEQIPKIYRLLEEYGRNKEIIVFKSREEADEYLISYDC